MTESPIEVVPELLDVVVSASATLLLSVGGLYAERFALASVQHGRLGLGLWAAILGFIALCVAFLLTRDRVLPTVASLESGG